MALAARTKLDPFASIKTDPWLQAVVGHSIPKLCFDVDMIAKEPCSTLSEDS